MKVQNLKKYVKPSYRKPRIEQTIREVVSTLLRTSKIKDRLLRDVPITVTHVKCSDDLRYADVFVSRLDINLPSAAQRQMLMAGFRRASAFITSQVSHELTLHRGPELRFQIDDDLYKAEGIIDLIDRVKKSELEGKTNER